MRPISGILMHLAIISLMLMAVAPMTFGASERIALGQYYLSFDLNTPLKYTIEVLPTIVDDNGTSYGVYIRFTNQTKILMGIAISKNATDSTFEPGLRYVRCQASRDKNATVTTRSVDNKIGIETTSLSLSGDPTFTYRSWLDSRKCDCGDVYAGTTKLEIIGIVPTNISENLLKTLHVASLTGDSTQKMPGVQPNDKVQLSGKGGATIAGNMQTQPPLRPTTKTASNRYPSEIYNEDPWLNSFNNADPAYLALHEWANAETG